MFGKEILVSCAFPPSLRSGVNITRDVNLLSRTCIVMYYSFMKYVEGIEVQLRFIDSLRFMASALEKFASYLDNLKIAEPEFKKSYTTEQIELLERKGVFPYDYGSSLEKLEKKELPTKEDFHSSLYNSDINEKDYQHAQKVWQSFDI